METLNLPFFEFTLRRRGNVPEIFDATRRMYVALTPEEWVRQNFLQYLIQYKNIPQGFVNVEGTLQVGIVKKRFDILVYNQNHIPVLLIECKRTMVDITQKTFDQICRYNLPLQVPLLIVTNGLEHYCFSINKAQQGYDFLNEIPNWDMLNQFSAKI